MSTALVETVRGPVAAESLGQVLMHEHIGVGSPEMNLNIPELVGDEAARDADAVKRLRAVAECGISTIVDLTVLGLGRDVGRARRVNDQVDINIIVATGYYPLKGLDYFYDYHGPGKLLGGEDPLITLFIRELTEGIADTGIKAGVLKCAIEEELTPDVERVMVAVAAAHHATGAPITVHTSAQHRTGLDAQRILRREGVDLTSVVIGHSGDTTDLDYLRTLAEAGSLLGMDRFGLEAKLSDAERVDTVARLAREGLAGSMVLSHDACCHINWLGKPGVREAVLPNWHHTHISEHILPALADAGVTPAQIDQMLISNPRRHLTPTA
ncbi:phosphotriesterase family protein [Streptomyces sp. NPDC055025]